jgi:hypothetical protein
MFKRRHHCRKCGSLVCHDHSKNTMTLPNMKKNEKVRVCDNCFKNKDVQGAPTAIATSPKDGHAPAESIIPSSLAAQAPSAPSKPSVPPFDTQPAITAPQVASPPPPVPQMPPPPPVPQVAPPPPVPQMAPPPPVPQFAPAQFDTPPEEAQPVRVAPPPPPPPPMRVASSAPPPPPPPPKSGGSSGQTDGAKPPPPPPPPPPARRRSLTQQSPELTGLAMVMASRSAVEEQEVSRAPPPPPPQAAHNPRMDLLSAIKSGGSNLKSVTVEPKAPPPPDTSNLLGMLAVAMSDRRVAFVQEDGSDSDASGFSDDD